MGQDSALQKKVRPSFRRGGNSNLRYPDLSEPVLALIFILKKNKSEKSSRSLR